MAKFAGGILGAFSGKVGSVIGGNWKGIDYMRGKARKTNRKPTQSQAEQQAKFKMMVDFLKPLSDLFVISYSGTANQRSPLNSALSKNMKMAVTGTWPNFGIDYSQVSISKGDMPNAKAPTAVAVAGGMINFTWRMGQLTGKAKPTDKCIVVVYCPDLEQFLYIGDGAARSTEAFSLDAEDFIGKLVHTWLGFVSVKGDEIANSIYTGAITVS